MPRPRKRLRKAIATVLMVLLVSFLTVAGLVAIWVPVQGMIDFEPDPTLTIGSGFGPPKSDSAQWASLIFDSVLMIGLGISMWVIAAICVISFISSRKE